MRRHLVTALCLTLLAPAALAQKAPKDVSELRARLDSSTASERASAARSIGYQKDAALPAVPRLLELLAEMRPYELWSAYRDLTSRGKAWTRHLTASLAEAPRAEAALARVREEFAGPDDE